MTIQQITAVCDGWDARVIADTGEAITLHYASKPAEVAALADCAAYVAAVADAKAAEAAKIAAETAAEAAKEAKVAAADTAIATATAVVAQAQVEIAAAEAKAADHLTLIDAWKKLEQGQRDKVLEIWPQFEGLLKEAAK